MTTDRKTDRPVLTMHWVAVTGTDGRTRMEARWVDAAAGHTAIQQHAA